MKTNQPRKSNGEWTKPNQSESKLKNGWRRFVRNVKRFFLALFIIGLIGAGYEVYGWYVRHSVLIATPVKALVETSTESAEILANRLLTEKLEDLQYELVDSLAKDCETKGHKDPDSVIIFDSNNEPSIGAWQYQRDTVVRYYKKFYGQEITRTEAIAIAIDHDKARELTRKILFEEEGEMLGGGFGNWTNCARKLGLPAQIELLNRLSTH